MHPQAGVQGGYFPISLSENGQPEPVAKNKGRERYYFATCALAIPYFCYQLRPHKGTVRFHVLTYYFLLLYCPR